ncbi:MAG TPA: hypothetical protein VHZ51_17790 [Ktedonobacteraceae bacterium]|jgi:hypothetical protein|nr:hypothetical protein [Ktedonobacteraceae bacterium]
MAQKQKTSSSARHKDKAQQVVVPDAERQPDPAVQPEAPAPQHIVPHYPTWPTSKPGPWVTPPPPGTKPINAWRREQVVEVGYNQETGTPETLSPFRYQPDEERTGPTSPDQAQTAQEALQRRKRRIE